MINVGELPPDYVFAGAPATPSPLTPMWPRHHRSHSFVAASLCHAARTSMLVALGERPEDRRLRLAASCKHARSFNGAEGGPRPALRLSAPPKRRQRQAGSLTPQPRRDPTVLWRGLFAARMYNQMAQSTEILVRSVGREHRARSQSDPHSNSTIAGAAAAGAERGGGGGDGDVTPTQVQLTVYKAGGQGDRAEQCKPPLKRSKSMSPTGGALATAGRRCASARRSRRVSAAADGPIKPRAFAALEV